MDFDKIGGVLKDAIAAAGVYKFAIATACAAYWYFAEIGKLPNPESWEIRASAAGTMLFGAIWLASVVLAILKFSQFTDRIKYKLYVRSEKRRIHKYIPYMSATDRQFLGALLTNNQKTFVTDMNGGRAVSLIAQRLVYRTTLTGHTYNMLSCPYEIPDHVWEVLEENRDSFLK